MKSKSNKSTYSILSDLWQHLEKKRRFQLLLILILMLFSSIFEVISISAVIPFLGALTNPLLIYNHPYSQPLINYFGISTEQELLLPITSFFIIAAILAGLMRLVLLWLNTRISFSIGTDISVNIYKKTLYQPYIIHTSRSTSEVIDGVFNKTTRTTVALKLALDMVNGVLMMTFIVITLLYINFTITAYAALFFLFIYLIIIKFFRKTVMSDSERVAFETTQIVKILQEGLGGIKDVIINKSQETYTEIFRKADQPYRLASARNLFAASSPRYIVESVAITLIAIISYLAFSNGTDFDSTLPILGALALGGQRLLPIVQQIYAAWTGIQAEKATLKDTLLLLNQPMPHITEKKLDPIKFNNQIKLRNVSFSYQADEKTTFKNINLTFNKGDSVGIIGKTGSGKSTLVDLLMGIIQPTEGTLEIDNHIICPKNLDSWMDNVAHVQQNIFLLDRSIYENIAFGIPYNLIDKEKVYRCAKLASIDSLVNSLSDRYDTSIGERGVRLSGGECQRIGIARALYREAKVIFFDEATSALDNETEKSVMEAIKNLDSNITKFIIAHRLSTIEECNKVLELSRGSINLL